MSATDNCGWGAVYGLADDPVARYVHMEVAVEDSVFEGEVVAGSDGDVNGTCWAGMASYS